MKTSGMNGSVRYQRRTTSEWEKLIARFEHTGQTRKSFCWGLCRKVPKRPHSGRRFGWGMGNIRKIWTRLMPSRKLFPGALCAMPVSS